MDNSYKINDNRNIKFFSKKTFCGLLITDSFQNLKKYILKEPNFNKALFCALDLLSSGKCDKLMQTLIMIYCKNINTKNPSSFNNSIDLMMNKSQITLLLLFSFFLY